MADLTLRFGPVRVRARVYWPAAQSARSLTLLLPAARQQMRDEALARGLCTGASSIVVALSGLGVREHRHDLTALGWISEHGTELGAYAFGLVVAGHADGGAAAVWLALAAREQGWPALRRQLLVHPKFTAVHPLPRTVGGVAPATIVRSGEPCEDGGRYAAQLRRARIDVDELHRADDVLDDENRLRSELFTGLGRAVQGST